MNTRTDTLDLIRRDLSSQLDRIRLRLSKLGDEFALELLDRVERAVHPDEDEGDVWRIERCKE